MEQEYVLESLIVDAVNGTRLDPERAIRVNDYGGRGMYNQATGEFDRCFGVVGNRSDLDDFLVQVAQRDQGVAEALATDAKYDEMGLKEIVYFPHYRLQLDC